MFGRYLPLATFQQSARTPRKSRTAHVIAQPTTGRWNTVVPMKAPPANREMTRRTNSVASMQRTNFIVLSFPTFACRGFRLRRAVNGNPSARGHTSSQAPLTWRESCFPWKNLGNGVRMPEPVFTFRKNRQKVFEGEGSLPFLQHPTFLALAYLHTAPLCRGTYCVTVRRLRLPLSSRGEWERSRLVACTLQCPCHLHRRPPTYTLLSLSVIRFFMCPSFAVARRLDIATDMPTTLAYMCSAVSAAV